MNKREKIKNHFQEKKDAYIGIGLVVGVGIVAFAGGRMSKSSDMKAAQIAIGKEINQYIMMIKPGNSGDILRDPETGMTYLSKNQAADALGVSRQAVMKKLTDGDLVEVLPGDSGLVPA